MKQIFQPFTAHNFKAKNRLVRSATWENLATPEGGICENSYELYNELAAGGVGILITGFTSVDAHDRYFGGMMRLCDDSLIPEYKRPILSRSMMSLSSPSWPWMLIIPKAAMDNIPRLTLTI